MTETSLDAKERTLGSSLSPTKKPAQKNGASERTRTSYPQFRKLLLYPDELRRRALIYNLTPSFFQALIYPESGFEFQRFSRPIQYRHIRRRHACPLRCPNA